MSYVAARKVNISGKVFEAGEEITGISEARCRHLLGRFLKESGGGSKPSPKTVNDKQTDDESLEEMTVDELESMADDLGIDIPSRARKADIIKAIEDAAE